MFTRGDEQRAVEAPSFTQAHIYLLHHRYSMPCTISIQTILGDEEEWTEVLTLAKSHQWTALKTFVLDKPVLKKVVFTILELASPRLYQVCFQDDHSTTRLSSL